MAKTYLLIIKADTNDGDYVTRTKQWTEGDSYAVDLEKLKKVAETLKTQRGTWGCGDIMDDNNNPNIIYKDTLTDEEIDWFNDLKPYGEYGIHTIEDITLYEISDKQTLY